MLAEAIAPVAFAAFSQDRGGNQPESQYGFFILVSCE
jgi:hypothetical protein